MKKLTLLWLATLCSTLALADVIIDPPKQPSNLTSQPEFQLLLVLGAVAVGGLFYMRYSRARKKS
jgi:hypothetical protein